MAVTGRAPRDTQNAATRRAGQQRRLLARPRILLGLAGFALIAAVVGALGPATDRTATYTWPTEPLPAATPDRHWYTPLLLIQRSPATFEATVPCSGIRPLPRTPRPLTLLATARRPIEAGALSITSSSGRLVAAVGGTELASFRLDSEPGQPCVLDVQMGDGRWVLRHDESVDQGDFEGDLPIVAGLFTGVDLRASPTMSVRLETVPFGTTPTLLQKLAWIVSALVALLVLGAVAGVDRLRPHGRSIRPLANRAFRSVRLVDAFVVGVVLVWWVLGPSFYDDGWVKVRQANYDFQGGFSNYYTTYGANLPLDFWVEWMQHWVVGKFDDVLALRSPAIGLILASWAICRLLLGRLPIAAASTRGAQWTLGFAFLLFALSWNVTLRPEPVVAFLAVCSLGCAAWFLERPGPAPLALATPIVALGLTAHPAGLVVVAPLLVVLPAAVRWIRASGWLVPAAIVLSGIAFFVVLVTVGADLFQRLSDARGIRDYGDARSTWRGELERYLLTGLSSSPLRRESVALMVAAVLAFLLRRDRSPRPLLDLPAASLGLALVLMVPTPSKWIWHFGVLTGLAAVVIAAEYSRLREQASRRGTLTPFVAAGIVTVIAAWHWSPRINWGDLDLRTLDWEPGFELGLAMSRIGWGLVVAGLGAAVLVELARGASRSASARARFLPWLLPALALAVAALAVGRQLRTSQATPILDPWFAALALVAAGVAAGALVLLVRQGGKAISRAAWSLLPWLVPLAVIPTLMFTVMMLVSDAVKTPAWTLTSQNLASLRGDLDCGLAEDATVASPGSVAPVPPLTPSPVSGAASAPLPPIAGLERFSTLADGRLTSRAATPWYPLPESSRRVGFYLQNGADLRGGDLVVVRWGKRGRAGVRMLSAGWLEAPREDIGSHILDWTFVPQGELPLRPANADALQLVIASESVPPRAVALTGAVSYRTTSLAALVRPTRSRSLILPNLGLFFPCAKLPRLAFGIIEPPTLVVGRMGWWALDRETNPFTGVLDLYRLRDLSIGDSEVALDYTAVLWVDRELPGAAIAPVLREDGSS